MIPKLLYQIQELDLVYYFGDLAITNLNEAHARNPDTIIGGMKIHKFALVSPKQHPSNGDRVLLCDNLFDSKLGVREGSL